VEVGNGDAQTALTGGVVGRKIGETLPAAALAAKCATRPGPSGNGRFIRKLSSSFIFPVKSVMLSCVFCNLLVSNVGIVVEGCTCCSSSSSSSSASPNSSKGLFNFLMEFDLEAKENLTAAAPCFENKRFFPLPPPFGLIEVNAEEPFVGGRGGSGC
jgi:hypothetical protein